MKILIAAAMCCALTTAAGAHNAPKKPKAPIEKIDTDHRHSGGTDKNGCHKDHKNGDFHCH